MDRLSKGEKVLGVSAALLFILSFIKPWAKIDLGGLDIGGLDVSANAWDSYGFFPLKLGFLLALAAIVFVGLRAAGVNMNMPVQWGVLYLALGGLTLLLVLIALLSGPVGSGIAGVDRGFMLYIGIILAAGMAAGGYLHWQEEGGTMPMGGGPTTPPAGGPPPPPAT